MGLRIEWFDANTVIGPADELLLEFGTLQHLVDEFHPVIAAGGRKGFDEGQGGHHAGL